MIVVEFCLEDNVWSDEIKICYIFESQSNENRAFRFFFWGGGGGRGTPGIWFWANEKEKETSFGDFHFGNDAL